MAVVLLASASGSPGVTTTAVGLALHWPRDVLLADCDRHPSQSVQAGWLQGVDLGGRGLGQLAAAHRERRRVAEEVWLQTVPLTDELDGRECRFLPGFTHPGTVGLFEPVWAELADALGALGATGTDVLVDAGRVACDGLPRALVAAADLVLVVAHSSLRSLAGVRMHLPALQAQVQQAGGTPLLGLLVVGPGRPYASSEIEKQFAVPVLASVSQEPRHAQVYSDGATAGRGFGGSSLARSLRAAASSLDEQLQRRGEVLVGARPATDWGAR